MVRLVVEFQSEPEVVAAIIAAVAAVLAALIGGIFLVRAARIQASNQQSQPSLPAPAPRRRKRRRRRRATKHPRPP